MTKKSVVVMLLAAVVFMSPTAYAARKAKAAAQNAEMLAQSCFGCHGSKGISVASPMPSLGGQNEAYLSNAMLGFQNGERPGTVMPRLMKAYSDAEIRGMAMYLAKQRWTPGKQEIDVALAEKGKRLYQRVCKDCHPNGGRESSEGEYPLLAGQWLMYTQTTVAGILAGKHKVDSKFEAKLGELTPQEIDSVLHFFASQQ
jgi:cytochrome subunit of sulfide dehydrogenase